jgi:hypothetical protein
MLQTYALKDGKKEDFNKQSNLLCILVAQTLTKEPFSQK